ncbi:hypothetical protein ACOZ38_25415 [Sphaerisporangium viridialbum]|uniref:hypothetical protein n=1 Tax=Sphaerisporangium viridialbum TaxID=46189 RepID=UPI003C72DC91
MKRGDPIYHGCAMRPICKAMIPIDHLMCPRDWRLVPSDIKSRVNLTYRRRSADWELYEQAVRDAKDAVRQAHAARHQGARITHVFVDEAANTDWTTLGRNNH